MKKLISIITIISFVILCLPTKALADEFNFHSEYAHVDAALPMPTPIPGEKDPGMVIEPLKRGQVASFTGILLSPQATAKIIADYDNFDKQIQIEVQKQKDQDKAACDLATNNLKADLQYQIDSANVKIKDQNKEINELTKDLEKESNKTSGLTWFALGGAAGVGLSFIGILIVNALKK